VLLACATAVVAVEVRLDLPDPVVVGVVQRAVLTIENAVQRVERVELPEVAGLEWRTDRTEHQIQVVNNRRTTRERVHLLMRFVGGTPVEIPAITVLFVDGSHAASRPRTVTPQPPDATLAGEVVATVTFEPSTIVPGQPATMSYRVALRQDRPRAVKQPMLTPPAGLLITGERSDERRETIDRDGREWQIHTWQWPVTAAAPGTYAAQGQQEWYRCRQDFFGNLAIESTHQAPIRPVTLTVTPLPDAGRPDDFAGLIGPLAARATVERTRIATGEGTVLTVTLTGPQVSLGRRPVLTLPAGVQAYPKDDADDTAGVRHYRWDLVPGQAGEISIPALTFPYFDPATRTYQRASTDALSVTVVPGRARDLVVAGRVDLPDRPAPTPLEDTRVALPPPLRGGVVASPPERIWPAVLLAMALGALAGVLGRWHARPRRRPHAGQALAAALARADLDAAAGCLQSLRPALTPAQRMAADQLEQAIDRARFGHQPVAGLEALAAALREVP
jgi:hypothetical protein